MDEPSARSLTTRDGPSPRPACSSGGALYLGGSLGTEFLPQLDEGVIWIRANLPAGISVEKSAEMARRIRLLIRESPEVNLVASQTGRNDSGTDPFGPNRNELLVDLRPYDTWRAGRTKAELVEELGAPAHRQYPGRGVQLHPADHRHGHRDRDGVVGGPRGHHQRTGPPRAAHPGPADARGAAAGARRGRHLDRAGGRPGAARHRHRPPAGRPLRDQRERRAGRHRPGAGRRADQRRVRRRPPLRRGRPLRARGARQPGRHRRAPDPDPRRRAGPPGPARRHPDVGRREHHRPAREPALDRGAHEHPGPRPGRVRRRGPGAPRGRGHAAARLQRRLGRAVRELRARPRAIDPHHADHARRDLHPPVRRVRDRPRRRPRPRHGAVVARRRAWSRCMSAA